MSSIVGVDPGKGGGFALVSGCGRRHKFWEMPLTGGKVCGVGIANVYKEIASLCSEPPTVAIEKIFTMPTDAVSQKDFRTMKEVCSLLRDDQADEARRRACELPASVGAFRLDGRVGNLTYALGAGLLEMPHLWGWSIIRIPPRTWCNWAHQGLDRKMKPKDRSRKAISQFWPDFYREGSPMWPKGKKRPHEGIMDALLIAEYVRLSRPSTGTAMPDVMVS